MVLMPHRKLQPADRGKQTQAQNSALRLFLKINDTPAVALAGTKLDASELQRSCIDLFDGQSGKAHEAEGFDTVVCTAMTFPIPGSCHRTLSLEYRDALGSTA